MWSHMPLLTELEERAAPTYKHYASPEQDNDYHISRANDRSATGRRFSFPDFS
jgi:hypothetical protein